MFQSCMFPSQFKHHDVSDQGWNYYSYYVHQIHNDLILTRITIFDFQSQSWRGRTHTHWSCGEKYTDFFGGFNVMMFSLWTYLAGLISFVFFEINIFEDPWDSLRWPHIEGWWKQRRHQAVGSLQVRGARQGIATSRPAGGRWDQGRGDHGDVMGMYRWYMLV